MTLRWKEIVNAHMEIVKRGNRRFFTFFEDDIEKNYINWTPLESFEPPNSSGPWSINSDQVFAERFLINVQAQRFEKYFIAGPLLKLGYRKGLRPLYYRDIELELNGSKIRLLPSQSRWSLTPEVYNYISELVAVDDPRKITEEIFENAAIRLKQGMSLSEALYTETLSLEGGDLEKYIQLSPFQPLNSNWIIFASKDQFGQFDIHLGRDYRRLKDYCSSRATDMGGLNIFEKKTKKKTYSDKEIYSVIDLDESQRKCVKALMSDRPLTVITGPPGTGKSQVVVSALLNAWANKKTALFVSNNNQAVEVVRERLESFQEDMPMFIRAGSRKFSNMEETLNEIMMIISDFEPNKDRIKNLKKKSQEIYKAIEEINKHLATGHPKEITEAFKAALNAYRQSSTRLDDIANIGEAILERVSNYGSYITSDELEAAIAATQAWYEDGLEKKNLFDEKKAESRTLEINLATAEKTRLKYAKNIGIEVEDTMDWSFLDSSQIKEFQDAFNKCFDQSKVFSEITPPDEGEWHEIYDLWEKAEAASAAAEIAEHMIQDMENNEEQILETYQKNKRLGKEKSKSIEKCKLHGFEKGAEESQELYEAWIHNWKKYLNTPESDLDDVFFIGMFTKKSTALAELKKTETNLFQSFPTHKVGQLQPINDDVRKSFSEEIVMLSEDARINADLKRIQEQLETMKDSLNEIKNKAKRCSFDFKEITGDLNEDIWGSILKEANEHKALAEKAVSAIEMNNEWLSHRKDLKHSVENLLSTHQGSIAIQAWKHNPGAKFYKTLEQIQQNPSFENNNKLLKEIYKGSPQAFITNWENLEKENNNIRDLNTGINEIDADIHLKEWLQSSTMIVSGFSPIIKDLKESFDDLIKLEKYIKLTEQIVKDWNTFTKVTEPQLINDHQYERERSLEQLQEAVNLVPKNESETTEEILKRISEAPQEDWPLNELSEAFSSFNSEALTNRLEAYSRNLNELEFHRIKENWLTDITGDDTVSDAIDSIILQGNQPVGSENEEDFIKVTRAIPIWISTTQSLQSVPVKPGLFDLVIIDEASQCTTTNILPVLFRGKKVGMIGDPNQLSPIYSIGTKEEEDQIIETQGLTESDCPPKLRHYGSNAWMAAWSCLGVPDRNTFKLNNHYRSDPQIIGFSNANIYRSGLNLFEDQDKNYRLKQEAGVHMVQVSGASQRQSGASRSWFNEAEAKKAVEKAASIYEENRGLEIGIVTPYRAQLNLIKDMLQEIGMLELIKSGTADTYQGDERDIMIFSPVISRGMKAGSIGWVEKPHNRINVAVTRARHSLYVVGDINFCAANCSGILQKLAIYCRDIDKMRRANSPGELELHKLLILQGYNPKIHYLIKDIEVDFFLTSDTGVKLVIEVDGSQHQETVVRDQTRDATLKVHGYEVLRFEARDIKDRPIDVIKSIKKALE